MNRLRIHPDTACIALLTALWMLFFWRLLTPVTADQASLKMGDFSGQFVAFAGYQYTRFSSGEIPLWNPYNNGGLPFIADTQAAVFYPPRLVTLALSKVSGGFSYQMLQFEMMAHVLAYTLLVYVLVRRMTLRQAGTHFAGVAASVVGGYGGFLSGYPPLQLAILEAAAWLPLALLGILEFTRNSPGTDTSHLSSPINNYAPLLLTAIAFGLSWLAGHPQTTFFTTYLLLAFMTYRIFVSGWRWKPFIVGVLMFGLVGTALAAVVLLPGGEYLSLTTRAGFGFDAKGNGFPLQDLTQFIFPGVVSVFSPLYVGVSTLALVVAAIWRRAAGWPFWLGVTLFALVWSLGAHSLLYPLLYNVLPGLYPFRGQERAAFLVSNALAILAGLGMAQVVTWRAPRGEPDWSRLRETLYRAFLVILGVSALAFVGWVGFRDQFGGAISAFALATLCAGASALLIPAAARSELALAHWGLIALLVFELFTVNMTASSVYDPMPASAQLPQQTPPLVAQVLADTDAPFRVDGFRGLTDNYGSFYGVADIRGISPLWLDSAHAIIESSVPNERAWEVFSVRYVFSDWMELPVPSTIVGRGADRYGPINLHRLENPRPFAWMTAQYEVIEDDAAARARLSDIAFDARNTVILNRDPGIAQQSQRSIAATVLNYSPEEFSVSVTSDHARILSVAQVNYPGWHVTINEQPASLLRAYGALMAVVVPPGEEVHVRFSYDPLTFRIGALISLLGWAGVGVVGLTALVSAMRMRRSASTHIPTTHT